MTNETMRIFFPLKVISYLLNDYDWDDENPAELSSEEAVAYEDAVLAAIAHENRRAFENDRSLAEYIENEALNKKVYSLSSSVEVREGKLWGSYDRPIDGSSFRRRNRRAFGICSWAE
ncbi:hypothetical protein SDC9_21998 [bioreactor metagenome]|uniref:Uncharacterized protein n=1 Tax=bioreactor metagenome TaxID=1076179 RepID=A0A644UB46_9ZZZZ|nr:hypothetical protein [Desulfitobacterium hafniense]MEA5022197.1 hypothetical protein [Desulfitobacterium hafniense]